jgi:stearoyl-CoA desaturase (delta-9 desaturase)
MMLFQADPRHTKQVMITQLIVAALSVPVLVYFWHWWYAVYLLGFYSFLLFVGHHAGLHRYFSHRSYSVNKFWHAFLCLASCLVCFGSPVGYAVIHRAHHVHTDTEQDPHAQKYLGFFNIIFFNWNLKDLTMWSVFRELRDPWLKFTHDYYILVIIIFALILFAIDPVLPLCYSVGTAGALFAMGFVNTVCHTTGTTTYRNHETRDDSSNSYIAVVIGEWHNNHHARPQQWNQRERWWELDYAAQFIRLIKK